MKKISIIGGGIIGLCTAYYLSKEGFSVTLFDRSDLTDGCSHGNAGMIVPSHVIPLAQPGMIKQGIKWMFDNKSPFYVKPRLDKELLQWGWKFYKHANQEHVENAMPALRDLSLLSKELYRELNKISDSFLYEEKGLLMLYKSDKVGEEVIHEGELAENLGLKVDFLSKAELTRLEKGTKVDAIGAVHYKSDAHLQPQKLVAFLIDEIEKSGGEIKRNCNVNDFVIEKGEVTEVITTQGNFKTDEVVIATGAWSPEIAKKIGSNLSLLPGKGYSFTLFNEKEKPSIPSILCEGKVAVTPMGDSIRYGGTMEITHTNDIKIKQNRLQGIVNTVNEFYPNLNVQMPKKENVWYGFRPCTPSGMPIITRGKKIKNIVFATGHAMMGLSLAPATGKIVAEIISEKPLSVSTKMFQFV
ncbi:NAD(P)/FAD-dependent oxidoreductase [Flavobacterium sp.]|uniref:NAD(P)/FAD-dependent oxidoreductase n=1 Tax=Flavobacterium sp. TaxID=239 RepID=UPI0040487950